MGRCNEPGTAALDTFGPWLRATQTADPAVRLLCFAHAGAGASSFNGWPRLLPPEVQLVKAQLPGREDNLARPALRQIGPLVDELLPQVVGLCDRPFAVYGHSMGALVAFEVTRALRRCGRGLPVALFVSGRRAPHKPLRLPRLHSLSDEALVAHLRGMGGTASELLDRPRWRAHYLPTMRADLELSDMYACAQEPPLDCPLYAFLGDADREMHREDWEAWSEQAAAGFERQLLPGGHILGADAQARLVRRIGTILVHSMATG